MIQQDITIKKIQPNTKLKNENIKILDLCGEGSYGSVYYCKYNDKKKYVIKFSENENPEILMRRYLILKHLCVKHIMCGNVLQNEQYNFYSIMYYGGITLKDYIKNNTEISYNTIISQLNDIVSFICENKILLPDFKTSNIVINERNELKLIDIYLECEDCVKNKDCLIIRTYPTIDICVCHLQNDKHYEYTYIYVLYGFILLELYNISISLIHKNFCKKYNTKLKLKKFVLFFQLSCALYHNVSFNNEEYNNFLKESMKNFEVIPQIYEEFINDLSNNLKIKHLSKLFIPVPSLRKNMFLSI
jgi:serine/threonine protein kinase